MFKFLAEEEIKHFAVPKKMYDEVNSGKKTEVKLPSQGKPKFGKIFSEKFMENLKCKITSILCLLLYYYLNKTRRIL